MVRSILARSAPQAVTAVLPTTSRVEMRERIRIGFSWQSRVAAVLTVRALLKRGAVTGANAPWPNSVSTDTLRIVARPPTSATEIKSALDFKKAGEKGDIRDILLYGANKQNVRFSPPPLYSAPGRLSRWPSCCHHLSPMHTTTFGPGFVRLHVARYKRPPLTSGAPYTMALVLVASSVARSRVHSRLPLANLSACTTPLRSAA